MGDDAHMMIDANQVWDVTSGHRVDGGRDRQAIAPFESPLVRCVTTEPLLTVHAVRWTSQVCLATVAVWAVMKSLGA